MIKINNQDILEMKKYIEETYASLFDCSLLQAKEIVEKSSFIKSLYNNSSYFMHYDDEYWAKRINEEYVKKLY